MCRQQSLSFYIYTHYSIRAKQATGMKHWNYIKRKSMQYLFYYQAITHSVANFGILSLAFNDFRGFDTFMYKPYPASEMRPLIYYYRSMDSSLWHHQATSCFTFITVCCLGIKPMTLLYCTGSHNLLVTILIFQPISICESWCNQYSVCYWSSVCSCEAK